MGLDSAEVVLVIVVVVVAVVVVVVAVVVVVVLGVDRVGDIEGTSHVVPM